MDEEAGKSKYGDQNVEESAERVGNHDDERVGHALMHREAEFGGELVADREGRLRERDARHQAHKHYNYEHMHTFSTVSTLSCAVQHLSGMLVLHLFNEIRKASQVTKSSYYDTVMWMRHTRQMGKHIIRW